MPLSLSDIFALPDRKRRRFRFIPHKRGRYRKEDRPKRTPDELVAWLRENNVRTIRQVEKVRKPGDPTMSDFRLAFPKWKDALDQAFGFQMPAPNTRDPEYMAKVVIQFNLWRVEDYLAARQKRPDIIPSYKAMKKVWGGFKGLKLLCKRYSMVAIFNEYLKLRRKLGRLPTMVECHENNVGLEKAIEFFGSRAKLDRFLDSMEKKK